MPLLRHHKGMKILANDVFFRRGGFPTIPIRIKLSLLQGAEAPC